MKKILAVMLAVAVFIPAAPAFADRDLFDIRIGNVGWKVSIGHGYRRPHNNGSLYRHNPRVIAIVGYYDYYDVDIMRQVGGWADQRHETVASFPLSAQHAETTDWKGSRVTVAAIELPHDGDYIAVAYPRTAGGSRLDVVERRFTIRANARPAVFDDHYYGAVVALW